MLKNITFQRLSSWFFRKITRIQTKWFKNLFISQFAKIYKIDWQDCVRQRPEQFSSFNDFFTRELKPEARPLSDAAIISPADGKIAACGQLSDTEFIHAKGHHFTLEALIADPELAKTFKNGQFATIYLSPRDYHRIHMPVSGQLERTIHIPGKLYSVSLKTAEKIPTLFAENERHVSIFNTEYGKIALILVGAINVSSMETVWQGMITPPYASLLQYSYYRNEQISLEKGAEMGRFNMGSTVIVITEQNDLQLDALLKEYHPIKLGEPLLEKADERRDQPSL